MLTACLPRRGDDRGTTLAETLVGAVLLVVVTALASTLLITGQRASADTRDRVEATEAQRLVYEYVTRVLRTGTSVFVASAVDALPAVQHGSDGRTVTVFANIDPPTVAGGPAPRPSRVTFSVDAAGRLEERVTQATLDAATGQYVFAAPGGPTETRRLLATRVLNTAAQPVFRYLQPRSVAPATACTLDEGCAVALSSAGTEASTLAARTSIRSITVELTLQATTPRADSATSFRGRVLLAGTGTMRASQ